MESVTNAASSAASAASRAIWGEPNAASAESGQEPLSGETGDVERGEPYDAGNAGNSTNTESTKPTASEVTSSTNETNETTASGLSSSTQQRWAPDTSSSTTGAPGNTAATGPIRSEHEQDKTGVISTHQPASGFSSDKPTSSNESSGPGPEPSVGANPASAAQNTQKLQGAERPSKEPSGEEVKAVKNSKDKAEEAQESHGEGTGEQYVKSSGMKAEGGDFDASQPGAGREADRLLETKGVHRETASKTSPQSSEDKDSSEEAGEKKHGLRSKIKGILHKK